MIIRNIPFDLREQHLKVQFERFGTLASVSVPLNNQNNLNRGFAFLEFENKEDAQKAIDSINGQKFKGRTVAMEFSLPKGRYETKVAHILENSNQKREDVIVPKPLRDERDQKRKVDEEKKVAKEEKKAKKLQDKKKDSEKPQQQGLSLFVRNISYDTTQEDLKEFMQRFGEVKYALLCKAKELQGQSEGASATPHKGTGFV